MDEAKKPDKSVKLSESLARTLGPGAYQDFYEKSLYLYVSKTGIRSFGFYKWSPSDGRPVRKAIGKWPTLRVEEARAKARGLALKLLDGTDIRKPPPEVALKLETLITDYTKKLRQEGRRREDWLERTIRHQADDWLDRDLRTITKGMIAERQRRIAYGDGKHLKRGESAGSTFVKAMRALFQYAENERDYTGVNAAKQVDRPPPKARQRILTEGERAAILAALESPKWPAWVKPFYRLLMLTGARRGNLAEARKDQIDLDAAVWVVPAGRSKNKYELKIHLRPEAVEIFRQQFARHPDSPWVFPSPYKPERHVADVYQTFVKVLAEAGVSNVTPHDLRRTFGSRLLNQKVPMEVVSKLLGHRSVNTTAKHYAFVTDETAAKYLNETPE